MTCEKRKLILSIISSLLIVCTLISASYAFYVIAVSEKVDIATTVQIPACASADLTGGTAISLSKETAVPISDMKALSSTNYRYSFTVKNNCNVVSNLVISLSPTTGSSMPISALKYALVEQGASVPKNGNYFNDEKLLSAQIVSEVKNSTNLDVKYGYEILNTTIASGTTKNYYLYIWVDYYEGDKTQTGASNNSTMGKSFSGQLLVSDYKGSSSSKNLLGDAIVALADGGEKTSSQDSSKYVVKNQNGYRYEGKNPNNYVKFNNETWRIIGSFEGSTIGLTPGEYYTKIIRPDTFSASIGVYNTTENNNNYSQSTVYKYMNGQYFDNFPDVYRSMVVEAKWYTGAHSSFNYTTDTLYLTERGSVGGFDAPSLLNVKAYLGLMYGSDYFYAGYGSGCSNTTVYLVNQTNACVNLNWLYNNANQYVITPEAKGEGTLIIFGPFSPTGGFLHTAVTNNTAVSSRPTLYLNSDVIISSGTGAQSNPYVISQ